MNNGCGMPSSTGFAPGLRPKRVTSGGMRTRQLRKGATAAQQQKQKEADMLVEAMYRDALWCTCASLGKVAVGAAGMALVHVIVCSVKTRFEL